jgi:hypothetical protein
MRKKFGLLTGLFLLCLGCSGCERSYTYNSIWKSVYGEVPPYQDKLESLELKDK